MKESIRPGMIVRGGDGARIGHVDEVAENGFRLAGGAFARFEDVIEIREGEVWVSTHRPDLGEAEQAAPRS